MASAGSVDKKNQNKPTAVFEASAVEAFTLDDIRRGIAEDQFYLLAQAQVNLETFELVGFECLARWRHPQQGEIAPFRFIPLLEEQQQCHLLTLHLFARLLSVVEGLASTAAGLHFSLNISAHDLCREDFADQMIEIARQHDIAYGALVLEVTETAGIFGDTSVVNLRKLKAFGIQLAVDDFWTGFSTLETIRLNLFSEIKIDYSLTSQLLNDKTSMAGTNAILQLSSNLGLRCIVEGIETGIARSVLLEAGAVFGQGFLFSRGVADAELKRWIHDYRADQLGSACKHGQIAFTAQEQEQLELRPHPSWVWDFDAQAIVWANSAALLFWQVGSAAELRQRDFSQMSYTVRTRLESYRRRLQAGEEVITSEWDFFPSGDVRRVFCLQVPRTDSQTGKMVMLVSAFEGFHSRLPQRKYIESSDELPVPFLVVDESGRILRMNRYAHIDIDFTGESITELMSEDDFASIWSSCASGRMLQTLVRFRATDGSRQLYIRALMLPDKSQEGRNVLHVVAIPVSQMLTKGLPDISS